MRTIEVEVTTKHANEGIPGEADCCALAMALKETYFPEDYLFVEVSSDGSVRIKMKGEPQEPRETLYTLYPDKKQEIEITNFIDDYDNTGGIEGDWDKIDYMNFPYNFKFFRIEDA